MGDGGVRVVFEVYYLGQRGLIALMQWRVDLECLRVFNFTQVGSNL